MGLEEDLEGKFFVAITEKGLKIQTPSQQILNIDVPNFSELQIGSDKPGHLHQYANVREVMPIEHISDAKIIFQNLKEEPFPTFGFYDRPNPVKEGDISDVPPLGKVHHHVDEQKNIIVNVTEKNEHLLHPGLVVRHLFAFDGNYYIATIGVGNGPLADLNENLKDIVWEPNVDRIRRESIYEDTRRNGSGAPMPADEIFAVLQSPMAEEFLARNPEIASLKAFVDLAGGDQASPAYQKFAEQYEALTAQGSYANLVKAIDEHLRDHSAKPDLSAAPLMLQPAAPAIAAPGL